MSGKPSITRVVKYIRKGDKGDAAETYKLVASHTAVSRTFDDTGSGQTYSPSTVNVKCVKVSGNESTVLSALPAGYYIKYSRDGGAQSKIAYSSISSSIVTGTLFRGGTHHLVTFYLYNSSNQCVAAESICLNDNGKNSISYSILPSISQFKTNAGRTITQTCTCKAYRTIAGKTPAQMGTNDGCVISVTGYDDNNVSHYGSDGSNQISFSTNSSNDGTYSTRFEVTLRVSNVEVAKISILVVMDGAKGEQGPALRGPQAWSDCEVGYQFYSGAEGEPYKDIVLYNGYFYSCRKTHQKATSILPTNTTYWTLGDKVELIAANVLFAEHGFFGDAIISGQWLISANGTISGTSYTKGRQYNGELAYNLFNADSPLGDDITKYNSVQGTSISSTEATVPKGTVNLEAGRVYYMTCVGFTNVANNPLYVRLVKSDDSSVAVTPINLNSTSAVTRSGYAHIMKSGTYRIELYHNTGNGNGVLISCKIVEKCFAPVFAINLRSGKVYQNDAIVKGNITATSGKIGGFNISENTIASENEKIVLDANSGVANLKNAKISGSLFVDEGFGVNISRRTMASQADCVCVITTSDYANSFILPSVPLSGQLYYILNTKSNTVTIESTVVGCTIIDGTTVKTCTASETAKVTLGAGKSAMLVYEKNATTDYRRWYIMRFN